MVPKQEGTASDGGVRFRAVLFRMVPKLRFCNDRIEERFRAVLFRMVPKQFVNRIIWDCRFRAVLFRMVPKPVLLISPQK